MTDEDHSKPPAGSARPRRWILPQLLSQEELDAQPQDAEWDDAYRWAPIDPQPVRLTAIDVIVLAVVAVFAVAVLALFGAAMFWAWRAV